MSLAQPAIHEFDLAVFAAGMAAGGALSALLILSLAKFAAKSSRRLRSSRPAQSRVLKW